MVHVPLQLLSICSYHLGFMNRCSQLKDQWMPNQAMAVLLTSHSIITTINYQTSHGQNAELLIYLLTGNFCVVRLRLESSKSNELHVVNGSRGAVQRKNPTRTGVSHKCPCSELENFVPNCQFVQAQVTAI